MTDQKKHENKTEFPGYPHYPAKEDIMNSKDNERVDVNLENLSRSHNVSASALQERSVKPPVTDNNKTVLADENADDIDNEGPTDTDLTSDDLIALGAEEAGYGKREELGGEDLDVPGAEEDDADEEIGEEDEENNYYSIGGDAHENLEEDKS